MKHITPFLIVLVLAGSSFAQDTMANVSKSPRWTVMAGNGRGESGINNIMLSYQLGNPVVFEGIQLFPHLTLGYLSPWDLERDEWSGVTYGLAETALFLVKKPIRISVRAGGGLGYYTTRNAVHPELAGGVKLEARRLACDYRYHLSTGQNKPRQLINIGFQSKTLSGMLAVLAVPVAVWAFAMLMWHAEG